MAPTSAQRIAATRIGFGLLQGLVLYVLHWANQRHQWPATDPGTFRALLAAAAFVPTIAILSVGNLRPRTLALWLAASAALALGLGFHAGVREARTAERLTFWWVEAGVLVSLTHLFFILHALVASGDADRRPIASFATYFDIAWKLGIRIALGYLFVGVFWGVLWLGAELFKLINLRFFANTIQQAWFWIPATAVAASASLHLTDARAGLVQGARTLTLGMLSWLMPVLTLIAAGFLVALLFTGLEPLWRTRFATASLLTASALLILLINSHFQEGGPESTRPRVLVYARFVAAIVLTPLVAIAVVGLGLRVDQYGWTPQRIVAAACLIAAGCHAVGYTYAAVRSGPRLSQLPATNIVGAFVMVALMLGLLTPLADPARLSVASQVARLEAGKVAIDKFDFAFLRHRSGIYGTQALDRLKDKKDGPNAAQIAAKAADTLRPTPGRRQPQPIVAATAASRAAETIVVLPPGGTLPQAFLDKDWTNVPGRPALPRCLTAGAPNRKCETLMIDLDDDGDPEIVMADGNDVSVFQQGAAGWTLLGRLRDAASCGGVLAALKAGNVRAVQPQFKSVEANGVLLPLWQPCPPVRR